jgi:D-sedoheptulose 7-phosphate isomerase
MQAKERLTAAIRQHQLLVSRVAEEHAPTLLAIADRLTTRLRGGGTIFLCGNGGSAADAQHVAGEFVGRFLKERKPLPAIALNANTSILTAIGNDYDFDQVFARQVKALVRSEDVVVGISTSGKSPNVIAAMKAAREIGAETIGFTGEPGEPLGSACDVCFKVPSGLTPRIQEVHILAWHLICEVVEEAMAHAG